jgi:hypothetical protein
MGKMFSFQSFCNGGNNLFALASLPDLCVVVAGAERLISGDLLV